MSQLKIIFFSHYLICDDKFWILDDSFQITNGNVLQLPVVSYLHTVHTASCWYFMKFLGCRCFLEAIKQVLRKVSINMAPGSFFGNMIFYKAAKYSPHNQYDCVSSLIQIYISQPLQIGCVLPVSRKVKTSQSFRKGRVENVFFLWIFSLTFSHIMMQSSIT